MNYKQVKGATNYVSINTTRPNLKLNKWVALFIFINRVQKSTENLNTSTAATKETQILKEKRKNAIASRNMATIISFQYWN